MQKIIIALTILCVLGAGVYFLSGSTQKQVVLDTPSEDVPAQSAHTAPANTPPTQEAVAITPGMYTVSPNESTITWSAKKPLLDGYINSGTIPVQSGTIEVFEQVVDGIITFDLTNLTVGLTAKKPGKESALEEHLKKADFFDVATYPTGELHIKSIAPHTEVATAFSYDVTIDLTLKGVTNEVTFPAEVFKRSDGALTVKTTTEIDRTKWGITFGSKSFFENLGDNMIDDMVALDIALVAHPAPSNTSTEQATSTLP